MAMSPRLLRPRATGFNPKSITGLALWLDASDSSTLFQNSDGTVPATATSDPVGAWLDKSGNARHATQSVSASRPTVGSSSKAGKNAVRNNGTGSVALQVAAWPYTAGNTQFAVFNASALNQAVAQRGTLNDEPRFAIQSPASGVVSVNATRGGQSAAQTTSAVGYPTSQWAIGATLFNTALGRAYRDGVYGADTTDSQTFSGDQELRLLSLPSNIYGLNGGIAEFLHYDRQLTASEVTRVARYLAARWGITLAPTVSNPDAQDWINRVYANGGSVSSSTAASVSAFCDSIDSVSGLRACFSRLNLFCGSNLNAALVPLYRSASFGGSPLGNATDTNNAFTTTDYSEASGLGPQATSSTTKYLDTGFAGTSFGATRHVGVFIPAPGYTASNAHSYLGSSAAGSVNHIGMFIQDNGICAVDSAGGSYNGVNATYLLTAGHYVGNTPSGSFTLRRTWRNGVAIGSGGDATATATSSTMYVFAENRNGTVARRTANGMYGYHFGLDMTSAQAEALRSAFNTFATAIGRPNV